MKKLINGIELIGESKDGGYKDSRYLIRTARGTYIQLSELLFQVVKEMQQEYDTAEIAKRVTQAQGKNISSEDIEYLIAEKLTPLGIIVNSGNEVNTGVKTLDLLLGLKYRFTIIPDKTVNILSNLLKVFFALPVIMTILIAFIALNIWIFFVHGIKGSIDETLMQPVLFLVVFAFTVLGGLFHELGHAAGLKYGKGKPGKIGGGIYIVWPAFYTDLTDAYRLKRIDKLRGDIGGLYFNMLFSLIIAEFFAFTHAEVLLLVILFQNIEMLHQLMPFLRLDGYFIVSDIVGLPDLFRYINPVLKSFLPNSNRNITKQLKPWVRWVITIWVSLTVPVLLYSLILMLLSLPEIMYTTISSLNNQLILIAGFIKQLNFFATGIGILQLVTLLLPVLGISLLLVSLLKRTVKVVKIIFNFSFSMIRKVLQNRVFTEFKSFNSKPTVQYYRRSQIRPI